jgi:epoxyqueuosine reductase
MSLQESRGFRMRTVPVGRLSDLRGAIERARDGGLVDAGVYEDGLAWFVFEPPADMPEVRSMVVVASRDPIVRFHFGWRGRRVPAVVPPAYLRGKEKSDSTAAALSSELTPGAARLLVRAAVPTKLLAVCSGLAEYGRNNITYVPGMGSFHRLGAYYSDAPCDDDAWREPTAMRECEGCSLCATICPTGAIDPGRFLLRAERCITFWNEKPGDVAFPDWIESPWHRCLVGCMECQRACPVNRDLLDPCDDGADFSEEETELLLRGVPQGELPAGLVEKLERCGMLGWLSILPRNLGALLSGSV